MAEIKFKGTIKNVYDRFLIVYEKHSKKNAQDEWETVGFTDFKVWLPDGMTGSEFAEKDYIEVTGRQKTEKTEKDGKTYKNLVVQAQVIETINSKPKTPNGLGAEWSELAAPF